MKLTRRRLLVGGALGLAGCAGDPAVVVPASPSSTAPRPPSTTAATQFVNPVVPAPMIPVARSLRSAVPVLARGAWGEDPGTDFRHHRLDRITIHHTAVEAGADTSGAERARSHLRHHRSLGWNDIAYHHLVDRKGVIYEGRPLDAVGDTATGYDPAGHYLPCLEGNFDAQEPSAEQIDALVRLVAAVADAFGLDPATIKGHGDHARTTCPGGAVFSRLDEIRARVGAALGRYGLVIVGAG